MNASIMMREKLRPDYQPLNWLYTAEIIGDTPQVLIDTGEKMNSLWNELVSLHERTPYRLLRRVETMFRDMAADAKFQAGRAREKKDVAQAERLMAAAEVHKTRADELKALAKEVAKQSYQGFDLGLRNGDVKWSAPLVAATIAERRASDQLLLDIPLDLRISHHTQTRGSEMGLPVWCKWHVGNQFKDALKAYAKKIRFAPRYKRGLNSIHIEQRTDSGKGWAVEELFARRKPFSIKPAPENNYARWAAYGWFSINHDRIPIKLTMHRPFPVGAIVKRYILCGKYEPSLNEWKWRMVFQLEVPPQRVLYAQTNRAVAIDFGWRVTDKGEGIRIAMIYDGHQFIEIVLPYDLTARRERFNLRNHPPIDIREAWRIRAKMDEYLEVCKTELRESDKSGWPQRALKTLRSLTRMKREGLMAVRRMLAEEGIVCAPIEAWLAKDGPAWKQKRHIEERWYSTRNIILRKLAAELADQCDEIRWEKNLDLKNMAEKGTRQIEKRKAKYWESGEWESRRKEEWTLDAAQRNRQLANLHKFRVWLREAMEKRGRDIIDDETAYSSQICHKCSSAVEPSPELIVKCSGCGALFDQDKNTARYYWLRFDDDTRAVAGPLASVKRSQLIKVWRVVSD
jgi:hypothetical protein